VGLNRLGVSRGRSCWLLCRILGQPRRFFDRRSKAAEGGQLDGKLLHLGERLNVQRRRHRVWRDTGSSAMILESLAYPKRMRKSFGPGRYSG
jgi:hypothetical protein